MQNRLLFKVLGNENLPLGELTFWTLNFNLIRQKPCASSPAFRFLADSEKSAVNERRVFVFLNNMPRPLKIFDDIHKIKKLFSQGYTIREIKREFNLSNYQLRLTESEKETHKINRFWRFVKKTENGCWEWQKYIDPAGYGRFGYKGQNRYAHQISYLFTNGVEPSKYVLHSCDNPCCVNPDHLREGSALENAQDRESRGRSGWARNYKKTLAAVLSGRKKNRPVKERDIEITKYFSEGVSVTQLAQMFELHRTTILRIIKATNAQFRVVLGVQSSLI